MKGQTISISDARDLHGLHTHEVAVLRWFVANGVEVGDTTLERMRRDTGLEKELILQCIQALAENGLLKFASAQTVLGAVTRERSMTAATIQTAKPLEMELSHCGACGADGTIVDMDMCCRVAALDALHVRCDRFMPMDPRLRPGRLPKVPR